MEKGSLKKYSRILLFERVIFRILSIIMCLQVILSVITLILLFINGESFQKWLTIALITLMVFIVLIIHNYFQTIRHRQYINLFKEIGDFTILKTLRKNKKDCILLALSENGDLFRVDCNKTGEVKVEFLTDSLSFLCDPEQHKLLEVRS